MHFIQQDKAEGELRYIQKERRRPEARPAGGEMLGFLVMYLFLFDVK